MTAAASQKRAPLVVLADTREQAIPPFPPGVEVVRATLSEADYTTEKLQGIAVVERKSASDFCGSITRGRERFEDEIRRLRGYRWKAIVVAGSMGTVHRASGTHPHAIIATVASFLARNDLAVLFVEGRGEGTDEAACGRMIVGLLRRWEERLAAELAAPAHDDRAPERAEETRP